MTEPHAEEIALLIECARAEPWTSFDVIDAGYGHARFRRFFDDAPSNVIVPESWNVEDDEPTGIYERGEIEPDSDETLGLRR